MNFNDCMLKMNDKDTDMKDAESKPLFKHDEDKLPFIVVMLGCDCLKRACNGGFSILFTKVFPYLVTWDVKEANQRLQERTEFAMNPEHKRN